MLLLAVLAVFALSHQLVVNPIPFPVLSFKTINHWPTESDTTWFALGELLVASGDAQDAKKWLQSAVDIDEDAAWTEAASLLESLT